jgi:hypothetical protein|tara:strand:- start:256 stop:429 length:174 start_codon:yes stop_codon:yes gene_type:complete
MLLSDFLDSLWFLLFFFFTVASFLYIPWVLFVMPAYKRLVQKKAWGEILGHDEDQES